MAAQINAFQGGSADTIFALKLDDFKRPSSEHWLAICGKSDRPKFAEYIQDICKRLWISYANCARILCCNLGTSKVPAVAPGHVEVIPRVEKSLDVLNNMLGITVCAIMEDCTISNLELPNLAVLRMRP